MKFTPDPRQKKMIKFLLKNPAAALFADPGLRKTASVLAAISILKEQKIVKKTLIIATKRIIDSTWPNEIAKWGFDFSISVIHGPDKLRALKTKADIYLMNYEGILWMGGLKGKNKKLLEQFDMVVFDESTKMKSWKSLRFKAMKKLLDYFPRRAILTGTPIPNGYGDLFSQIYLLDQGESLGRYITPFRNEYFFPSGYMGYEYTIQPDGAKRLEKSVKHLVLRIDDSTIKMPKQINNIIEVALPKKALKQYKDMEQSLAMDLKKGVVLASNGGVAVGKLRQIVNGHVYDNDKVSHHIHNAKIDALVELVEELNGKPLIVGYEFKADLQMILKALPYIKIGDKKIKTEYIGGGVDSKNAIRIEKQWNSGKLPLLLGHISSIAHGLNLQSAGNHICFYSQTWNLEDYLQFIRRVRRQGQKKKSVFVHKLVVKDSVDLDVATVLADKNATQKGFLKALEDRLGV